MWSSMLWSNFSCVHFPKKTGTIYIADMNKEVDLENGPVHVEIDGSKLYLLKMVDDN